MLGPVLSGAVLAQSPPGPAGAGTPPAATATDSRLVRLGPGDSLSFQVYGQPDMDSEVLVGDDGTIPVPLAGSVQVSGMSPAEAAAQVEKALRDGQFLVNPIVTLTVAASRSQRVSVLGEVGTPGRYPVDASTTVFDLLAEAGGIKETGSDTVYVIRTGADGVVERLPVDVSGLKAAPGAPAAIRLRPGDTLQVPRAEQVFVYGEVNTPDGYKLEQDMTVLEAIARAGGLTTRGSDRRVEIRRQDETGAYTSRSAEPSDRVQANDVIRVKERIF